MLVKWLGGAGGNKKWIRSGQMQLRALYDKRWALTAWRDLIWDPEIWSINPLTLDRRPRASANSVLLEVASTLPFFIRRGPRTGERAVLQVLCETQP